LNIGKNPKAIVKHLLAKGKTTQAQYDNHRVSFFSLNSGRRFYYFTKFDGDVDNEIADYILEEIKEPDKKYIRSIKNLPKFYAEISSPRGQRRLLRRRNEAKLNDVLDYANDILDAVEEYKENDPKISKRRIKECLIGRFGHSPKWIYWNDSRIERNLPEIYDDILQAKRTLFRRLHKLDVNDSLPPIYTYKTLRKHPELEPFLVNGESIFYIDDSKLTKAQREFKKDPNNWKSYAKLMIGYKRKEYNRHNNISNFKSDKSYKHKMNNPKKFGHISHNFTLPTEYYDADIDPEYDDRGDIDDDYKEDQHDFYR